MKYIDEYRDKTLILKTADKIASISKKPITLMEVCGGHTMSIHKFGLGTILPENVNLISGPGCPVCVTSKNYIDKSIALSKLDDVIITTYGDLIRVPGSSSSLSQEKAIGADIRIVYSTIEALQTARDNPAKKIIFLGVGFETTAPTSAAAILTADKDKISNFSIFSAHKTMPHAMMALIDEGVMINGYICPGHVSVITGLGMYQPIVDKYKIGCVVSGFEPLDLMQSIYMLVNQYEKEIPKLENQYKRAVRPEGNKKAQSIMNEVFCPRDDWWRGLGIIPSSGLGINKKFSAYDTGKIFDVEVEEAKEHPGCICGSILKGLKKPMDCPLFSKICNPSNPIGACMVSSEGACAAYYKYH